MAAVQPQQPQQPRLHACSQRLRLRFGGGFAVHQIQAKQKQMGTGVG